MKVRAGLVWKDWRVVGSEEHLGEIHTVGSAVSRYAPPHATSIPAARLKARLGMMNVMGNWHLKASHAAPLKEGPERTGGL